jgi:hypothetical protein
VYNHVFFRGALVSVCILHMTAAVDQPVYQVLPNVWYHVLAITNFLTRFEFYVNGISMYLSKLDGGSIHLFEGSLAHPYVKTIDTFWGMVMFVYLL